MKQKKWSYSQYNSEVVSEIINQHGYPEEYAKIISSKDITCEQIPFFFNPTHKDLHDPFQMKDMNKAVDLIVNCSKHNRKILVLGDYDVDGTTGTALLYSFLSDKIGLNAEYYIPNREREGYGLPRSGIDYAVQIDASLLITCDFGINAFEQVSYAQNYGLDIIITDHHLPQENIPKANAVLNPKQKDCPYPFKDLCGAGVAFKFMQAVAYRLGFPENEIYELLDLVCLGTAADIVPLVGENRIIMTLGLEQLCKTKRPGLSSLLNIAEIDRENPINVGQIVFKMAPRINALGRMGEGFRAVDLLTSQDIFEAETNAKSLDSENQNRRTVEKSIVDSAIQQARTEYDIDNTKGLVLWGDDWHPGVIGIVASRVKEEFYLPTIIISFQNGIGKGSGRSVEGLDLYWVLDQCSNHLENYGGHKMAAGISIKKENLQSFREKIQAVFNKSVIDDTLIPKLKISLHLTLDKIDNELIQFLNKMAPFGPGNMRPIFSSADVQIRNPKIVGNGKHLKFLARQNGVTIDAIAFNQAEHYEDFFKNKPIHLAYIAEENVWNGRKNIQLNIRGIKIGKFPLEE